MISHENILNNGRYEDLVIHPGEEELAKDLYRFMVRLRTCEESLAKEYHPADEMRCPVHFCVGQEAVPAALSLLIEDQDYLYSHHRSHGYYLAKHCPMDALFAELYGKETGANGGYAGSQDISYPENYFYSGAILAGATAIAAGTALTFKTKNLPHIAIAGFGESATDEGIFWETMNYSALAKLPAVFICENNKYSVFSPQLKRQAMDNLSAKVSTFGVKAIPLFGNDVMSIYRTLKESINFTREGNGPVFIETYTYRWSGHYGPASDDLVGYRTNQEVQFWKDNCPIQLLKESLLSRNIWDKNSEENYSKEVNKEIDSAFIFAKKSLFPLKVNWEIANINPYSPMADRLLKEISVQEFDANQVTEQIKGY